MTDKITRVAIYARVSTLDKGQDVTMQTRELQEYAVRRGWVAVEYVDVGISGGKVNRPSLDRMMADAKKRKFDVVLVWKFDRFARSVTHLLDALGTFNDLGIEFVSLSEALDTTTKQGKLMFTILGAMAEFERSLIQERVRAGMAHAKSKGHLPGPKRMALDMDQVRARMAAGESMRSVSRGLGCSAALLSKRLKAEAGCALDSALAASAGE